MSEAEKQWMRTERVRMVKSDAYGKIVTGNVEQRNARRSPGIFRLNAYIVGKARDRKILRVMNIFGEDSELGPVVHTLAER